MKKRLFALLFCAAVLWSALPAQASGTCVYDDAGLLTQEEAAELESRAQAIAQAYGCGLYIATVDDYRDFGPSPWDAACNIYIACDLGVGAGRDGLLLMLSMDDRDFATTAYGSLARGVFTDDTLQLQEEEFLDDFGDNEWYDGFADYLAVADEALDCHSRGTTIQAERARLTGSKLLAIIGQDLLIGLVIALIVCMILRAMMRSVRKGTSARAYMQTDRTRLDVCVDQFTHTTESRRTIEVSRSSGGGGSSSHSGGGFSGRSGKF